MVMECKNCTLKFSNLQECLKHELLEHILVRRCSENRLRSKVNSILKSFNGHDQRLLRLQLRQRLDTCMPGAELPTVLRAHCIDPENLEQIYFRILTCLECELSTMGALKIYLFGSSLNGLALKDSDFDIYIEHTAIQTGHLNAMHRSLFSYDTLNRISYLLSRSQCFVDVLKNRHSRVPTIKCRHKVTGFNVDINLTGRSGIHNSSFIRAIVQLDVRLHELLIFMKIWAKQLQLIGRGNMTSYCLNTLVIFYLQQPLRGMPPVLPSISAMQAMVPPNFVDGINYAYHVDARVCHMPLYLSTAELIKGFFEYYNQLEFERHIVAPFLGMLVPLDDFLSGDFRYAAYRAQQQALAQRNGQSPEALCIKRCMCVQDFFCLNQNIAKSTNPINLRYFYKCLHYAQRICTDPSVTGRAQLYELLLYGIVERIANAPELDYAVGHMSASDLLNALKYCFTPSRAEMRALLARTPNASKEELFEHWSQYYVEVIIEIVTKVYLINMRKMKTDGPRGCTTWQLVANVDMWTGRLHMRNSNITSMEFQRRQTESFWRDRKDNPVYSVGFRGYMSILSTWETQAIDITVTQDDAATTGLGKKNPLRKWFTTFKSTMQNFNFNDMLKMRASSSRLYLRGRT